MYDTSTLHSLKAAACPTHSCIPTAQALDALDSMAFSAMRLCVLSCANPDRGQGNSALVAALVAEGSSIGGLESEIRVPTSDKVPIEIGQGLVLRR